MTKAQMYRRYSYLPFKFRGCAGQKWHQIKANALAILRRNFPDAKFRVYKYDGDAMEVMFDGPQSKAEVYTALCPFETVHHSSAGYSWEEWSPWNFRYGGIGYVFVKKRGEDLTYYVLDRHGKAKNCG